MGVDSGGPGRGIETTPRYRQDHQPKVSTYDMDPKVAATKQAAWNEVAKQILANSAQSFNESSGAMAGTGGYSVGGGGGGGGSGGGGRGGGGGGGGVPQEYIDAMKAYVASKEAGKGAYLQPFADARSGIDTAYGQARGNINAAGAQQDQRLAAAKQLQDQYNAQLSAAYKTNGPQFDFGALMRDLQGQGAGTGGLAAQAALAQANQGLDASRRGTLADTLVAGRNFDNAQRGDIARQLTQGMSGQLDINHMAYLAQIAKQQAAADQAYQDQLAQLKLEAAKNGVQL